MCWLFLCNALFHELFFNLFGLVCRDKHAKHDGMGLGEASYGGNRSSIIDRCWTVKPVKYSQVRFVTFIELNPVLSLDLERLSRCSSYQMHVNGPSRAAPAFAGCIQDQRTKTILMSLFYQFDCALLLTRILTIIFRFISQLISPSLGRDLGIACRNYFSRRNPHAT